MYTLRKRARLWNDGIYLQCAATCVPRLSQRLELDTKIQIMWNEKDPGGLLIRKWKEMKVIYSQGSVERR